MTRDEFERAEVWMKQLINSTLWSRAFIDTMPLGAVVVDIPAVLVEDPSTLGVWTMSTLFVAPLIDIGLYLTTGSAVELGEKAFGSLGFSVQSVDLEAFETRKNMWQGKGDILSLMSAHQELGSHMGAGFVTRNSADYRQAAVGELIALDALRGSNAMLCARIVAPEVRESVFQTVADQAFEAVNTCLGPLVFCWQSMSGVIPSPKCQTPQSSSRAWPVRKQDWIKMNAVRHEAWELEQSLPRGSGYQGKGPSRV